MRKSGMAEKYEQLVQDMYEGIQTVVRCAVEIQKVLTLSSDYIRDQH